MKCCLRIPILIAFLLSLPLLALAAMMPARLASYEGERSIELENLEAEDVSLLDASQRPRAFGKRCLQLFSGTSSCSLLRPP